MSAKIFSKEQLIDKILNICKMGWIKSHRQGNSGGIGNTLEDLLGIEENNLPIPNAAEWELKSQRIETSSLITLFHFEPSPRTLRFVPRVLLPNYGWPHELAGIRYPDGENSFRQTITGLHATDRGFGININEKEKKIEVYFDHTKVDRKHNNWLANVNSKVGIGDLNPRPYWGYQDIFHKAGTKLLNTIYVIAESKIIDSVEYFKYSKVFQLSGFSLRNLINAITQGYLLIDFDARTGHNHGTKFRLQQNRYPELYEQVKQVN